MKLSKFLSVPLWLSFFCLGQSNLKGYPKFNMWDNTSYECNKEIRSNEGENYLYVWYDFNKNNKPDILAVYPFIMENSFGLIGENQAFELFVGLEKRRYPDYVLGDIDGNGTLESFIKGKHIRKNMKENIEGLEKAREYEL